MAHIYKESHLLGVRYWTQIYLNVVPCYEVFVYIGRDLDTGIFYFKSFRRGVVIGRSRFSLEGAYFKPFLIDCSRFKTTSQEECHADI